MTKRTELFFKGDECQGIYCGQRLVDLKIGRKWVRIKSPSMPRWSRMRRSMFDVCFGRDMAKAR